MGQIVEKEKGEEREDFYYVRVTQKDEHQA